MRIESELKYIEQRLEESDRRKQLQLQFGRTAGNIVLDLQNQGRRIRGGKPLCGPTSPIKYGDTLRGASWLISNIPLALYETTLEEVDNIVNSHLFKKAATFVGVITATLSTQRLDKPNK